MLSFFLGNIEVALSLMLSYFLAGGDHVLVCDPLVEPNRDIHGVLEEEEDLE
jgi:hypothetical protein